MRERTIERLKLYLKGVIAGHEINIDNILENPEGVKDLTECLLKDLEGIAQHQAMLESLASFEYD